MIYLLQHRLEASAQKYPEHDVVRFRDKALTYAQLSQKSNQLANLLHEQGIEKGDRVGVYLNKSLETLIAIYGIMKAGAAYVPLDPQSPVSRLLGIIEDCHIKGIISDSSKVKQLSEVASQQTMLQFVVGLPQNAEVAARLISWDDVAALPAVYSPDIKLIEHDLAYVMYTSGTTGKPKGIMHTHYSGLSYVKMSSDLYEVNHSDRLSNHSPLHFDMSTFDYLTGPSCGATTVIIPEAYTLFPANLSQLIEDERLTIWYSVPFALIQILQRGVIEQRDLSSLRWILYGGEPFPSGHLRKLMEYLPNTGISNVYGPAEVNQCTYFNVPHFDEWDADDYRVPIGVDVHNAESLILGEDDQILSQSEAGELVVRTATMMQGYWGRPELNAKAFYRQEIFPDYYQTYYRTGDLVKMRDDGLMDFLGRIDHQVKVRGYRVELAEVDNALNAHPSVEEASSFTIKTDTMDEIWAAAIITDKDVSDRDIIAFVSKRVPSYAVPSRIIFKDSFPRGGTGKIDRRALQQEAQSLL